MSKIVSILVIFIMTTTKIGAQEEEFSNKPDKTFNSKVNLCCESGSVLVNDRCEKDEFSGSVLEFDPPEDLLSPTDSDILNENISLSENTSIQPKISYSVGLPACPSGGFNILISAKDLAETFDKGYFMHNGDTYLQQEYCISRIQNERDHVAVRLCNITCGNGRLCFPKCCKWDEMVEESNEGSTNYKLKPACIKRDNVSNHYKWKPPIYMTPEQKVNENEIESEELLKIYYQSVGFPLCEYAVLKNDVNVWFRILQEGSVKIGLQLTYRPAWLPVSQSQEYCIDDLKVQANNANTTTQTSNDSQILFFCSVDNFDVYLLQRKLYGSLRLVSAVLLLPVLIINYLLWSTHKLSGWTIISLFTAMFLTYVCTGIDFLMTADGLHVSRGRYCFVKGLVLQYFFLAYGSNWVVVNYDMFRTFRNLYQQMEMWTNRTRLLVYLIFSWGTPALIVFGATTVYFLMYDLPENSHKGFYEYAFMSCYSPIIKPTIYYQMVIVILNVVFFLSTTILICKHRRSVRMASFSSAFGDTLKLFLKLSVLSGFFFIPFVVVDLVFSKAQTLSWFWFLFRANHFIADVFILITFGFNQKNIEGLRRKFPLFNKMFVRVMHIKSETTISNHNLAVISNSHRGSQSTTSGP